MKRSSVAFAFSFCVALLITGPVGIAGEGRNPEDDTSKSRIDDLFLGEHWFGAEVEDEDLVGKVVLFEIWGS